MYTSLAQFQVCDNTTALVANALTVNREHEPAWFEQFKFILCLLGIFLTGLELGFRLGHREGQRRGYPLDRYLRDAVDHIMREQ